MIAGLQIKTTSIGLAAGIAVLAACGARTGLNAPLGEAVDAGVVLPDIGPPPPPRLDAGVIDAFVPEDTAVEPPPDVWMPQCPDSVTVAAREATVPVDIIWAIDSSGSMVDDADRMRENIEIFWEALADTRIDARVVFVADRGYAPGAPAGFSGRYIEVDYRVHSHAGLSALLAAYDEYDGYLRPDAVTHFIVVTDDESLAMEWEDFQTEMQRLLQHDFTFHAVASEQIMPTLENRFGACYHSQGLAARPGVEYYELADATGGLQLSICNEDWSELVTLLTERIVVPIPLPCGYLLPRPPAGVVIDPDRFTVLWDVPGEPGPRVIPRAGGRCDNGWQFIEGSERVELCAGTCQEVEATGGRITVDLGCD